MRNYQRKINLKRFLSLLLSFTLLLITENLNAQQNETKNFKNPLTKPQNINNFFSDSIKINPDTIQKKSGSITDTSKKIVRVDSFNLKNISADSLNAPVNYSAEDSGVLDIPGKKFYLYGKANANYQTTDIQSAVIEIDNNNQTAKAYGVKDSLGNIINRPVFKDGEMGSVSDSMFYNMKTQKGLTKSTFSQQGEIFVYAERIKKVSANEYFAYKGRFTTCNLDTPHFAFRTKKMKLVSNKWAYSGIAYPEFEGVPVPVGIPFGIYPLSQGKHSGILPPTVTATQYFGLGLEGLGYYKVLNPYVDIMLRTNIYSYGGYMINIVPTYRKRYRYNGGFNLTLQKTQFNFKDDPDYSRTNTYSFGWNHSMDSKARPGVNFSANVNVSSSKFNQLVPNNSYLNFTNQLASSIQYSKTWGQGRYNLQASAQHNQNNISHLFNINLPNINFNINTFYPFEKKERIGSSKWYEKLGISYNTQILNQVSFYDNVKYSQVTGKSFFKHLIDTMQWGVSHSIPFTLSLPPVGPFTISPSLNYQEKWYGQRSIKRWNTSSQKLDTTIERNFFTAREITTGLNMQTALFGTYNFKKGNLVAIRHTIRPSIGINYKPDFVKQYYYNAQVNASKDTVRFSYFDNSIVGGFSEGEFGGISFGISQQLEAKMKDKKDTSGKGTKKIRLIDNLSVSSSYNFFADSCRLSDISIYMGTTLFEKINITANTSITPYQLNKFGQRTRAYAWEGRSFRLGSIQNGSLSISTNFQSKNKEEKKNNKKNEDYYNTDEDIRQKEYMRTHPGEFTDFNVPWTLGMSFSLNFYRRPTADYNGFETATNASLNLNGDFSLTPKWKMGGMAFYDFRTAQLQNLNMFISRDMHCWQLSINIVPVGLYRSFSITINPKSNILRDLRINRTRTFQSL